MRECERPGMLPCLYGPAQVDARFDGDVVGGLEEGPLQEQGGEEQHSQHVSVLQKLFGGNEIDPQQSHLKAAQRGQVQLMTFRGQTKDDAQPDLCTPGSEQPYLFLMGLPFQYQRPE